VKRRTPARAVVATLRDPADLPHSDELPARVADISPFPFVLETPAALLWVAAMMYWWTPGSCSGLRTRRRSHPRLRGRWTIPRPCRPGVGLARL